MRKFFKYIFYILLLIFSLMVIGFFTPRKWTDTHDFHNKKDSISIVISSNGYHSSFILPVQNSAYNWGKDFPVESNIKYIEFGWGNRRFYMSRDFSIKATLLALFPSKTVMHIVYLDKEPEKWFKNSKSKRIHISREDYISLVNYIRNSFELDAHQEKIYLGEGLYGPSSFYEGRGDYHALETCNTWVAEGLRKANVKTPLWGGMSPAIMWQLRNVE